MTGQIPPSEMPIPLLIYKAKQELLNFLASKPNNPAYGYELFRRALSDQVDIPTTQSESAWAGIIEVYLDRLVLPWARNHKLHSFCHGEEDFVANWAYEKMWYYFKSESGRFENFEALNRLLSFLKSCVNSVMCDYCKNLAEDEINDNIPAPSLEFEWLLSLKMWHCLQQFFSKKEVLRRKQIVAMWCRYIEGMPPREIYRRFSGIFKNIRKVYSTLDYTLEQLRGNRKAFNECLEDDHKIDEDDFTPPDEVVDNDDDDDST